MLTKSWIRLHIRHYMHQSFSPLIYSYNIYFIWLIIPMNIPVNWACSCKQPAERSEFTAKLLNTVDMLQHHYLIPWLCLCTQNPFHPSMYGCLCCWDRCSFLETTPSNQGLGIHVKARRVWAHSGVHTYQNAFIRRGRPLTRGTVGGGLVRLVWCFSLCSLSYPIDVLKSPG